jgi:cysteine synthase
MDSATSAPPRGEFRGRVYDSIIDTIGATPLVRLSRLAADAGAVQGRYSRQMRVLQPALSVKDRIGWR